MSYDYHRPESLDDALELLARHGEEAHVMAGGTAFVLMFRQGLIAPAHVVSLRHIEALRGIGRTADGGLRLGPLATHHEIERSADVIAYCPALADAFSKVATIRIRNQATVGGNLAHADPSQDPPAMLSALNATVLVASAEGQRTVPVDELFVDYFTTSLMPGEIITAIELPPLPQGTRSTYLKFLARTLDDYATVSIAAVLRLDDEGRCASARLVAGAAGPTPIRARTAEDALLGRPLSSESIGEAAAAVAAAVDPIGDARGSAWYKREMARVWSARALRSLEQSPA